jgi:hypothetical protein
MRQTNKGTTVATRRLVASWKTIFALTATSWVETLWIVSWNEMDFVATLYKDSPAAAWRGSCGFRYYHSHHRFDGEDVTNVYDVALTNGTSANAATIAEMFDEFTDVLAAEHHGQKTRLDVGGNCEAFMAVMMAHPWAHIKALAAEPPRPQ